MIYGEIECYNSICIFSENDKVFIVSIDDIKKKYNNYIIYCDGHGCPHSHDLAVFLYENFKLENILIYEGGMPDWKERGMPIK